MKLRSIVNFLIILILFLVNDAIYQSRNHIEAYLNGYKAVEYDQIENREAVLIIDEGEMSSTISNLGNQYYIDSVMVIQKQELVDMLARQYRLTDSQDLLKDLNLPQVVKCSFKGDSFGEMESGLFLEMIQDQAGISRLLYSEDNYSKSWEILAIVESLQEKIDYYWNYVYSGFALLILLIIFDISIIREKHNRYYWKIFLLSGGSPSYRMQRRLLSGIFAVLIPALLAFGGEYYFHSIREDILQPDLEFHIFRLALGLVVSIAGTFIIRKDKNA